MSFSEKASELVNQLIDAEYENCVKQYGEKYESEHKAFCVLMEEVLEACDEVSWIKENIIPFLLFTVNDEDPATRKIRTKTLLIDYERTARNAIKEVAQVCAVCRKFIATIEEGKSEVTAEH